MKTPWWFLSKNLMAFILVPVSWVYYLIGRIVFWARKKNAISSRRPVICVGNIFAGGVGKTPIVRAIANYFDAPVVMRGYKKNKKTGDFLFFQQGNPQVSSALRSLTSVFGMGTGISSSLLSPEIFCMLFSSTLKNT